MTVRFWHLFSGIRFLICATAGDSDVAMGHLVRLSEFRRQDRQIYFERRELCRLLALYSSKVARGEWRDYAIDHQPGAAIFTIFRHSFDRPLFAIAKLASGNHAASYQLTSGREKLGRSHCLEDILTMLERSPKLMTVD